MKQVKIYTDGACSGNPGPGAWTAILIYNETEKEISGYFENTTNNRMELYAAIAALKCLKEPCKVDLHSDSAYLINAFILKWIDNWRTNGWKTADKKPVENCELWQELDCLTKIHDVTWIKLKGHSTDEYNNRCDKIARSLIKQNNAPKKQGSETQT
ncbi:MAG TPA: ribonuclease HI [Clostridia bacterium]|nr:ribonuclease HI [Clostridia bacterium]